MASTVKRRWRNPLTSEADLELYKLGLTLGMHSYRWHLSTSDIRVTKGEPKRLYSYSVGPPDIPRGTVGGQNMRTYNSEDEH